MLRFSVQPARAGEPPRVAIPLSIAARGRPPAPQLQTLRGASMGTGWTVKFCGSPAHMAAAAAAIQTTLDRIVAQMSAWEPASDLCRINRAACDEWLSLPREFASVVACGLRIAAETEGAYDPCIGALVDLWGFGAVAAAQRPPSPDAIAAALRDGGWGALALDPARGLRRAAPVRLDVNGIAKGFAVDAAMAALAACGIDHALVEIGGELKGRGIKPDGSPWWTRIDRPAAGLAPDIAPPVLVALHEWAIATSGCERHFISGDRLYSHTIDPRRGVPIDNGMVTATVLHASCMEADAYATALMVMGPDAGLAFAAKHALAAVILFRAAPGAPIEERLSPTMEEMLG